MIAPRSAREIEGDQLPKQISNNVWRHPTTSWSPRLEAARAVAANRIEACSCTTRRRVQESALVLQVATRAGAAKWIATLLRATGCTFSLALTALQAAAQALTFVPLGPMTWILLSCIVAAIGAFGATHGRPLAPHLLASEACRTRCAQSAGCFSGLVGRSVFEPASCQQSGARPSGASQSGPLAVVLIIAGLGSCAADLSAPAPTQGSQPPAAPRSTSPVVWMGNSDDIEAVTADGSMSSDSGKEDEWNNRRLLTGKGEGGKGGKKGGSCGNGKGKKGEFCEPCIDGKLNGNGEDYDGTVAHTASGKTCKWWNGIEDANGYKYAYPSYGLTSADKK